MNQIFINGGILSRVPTDPTRFWIGVVYLASAVSMLAGLDGYLAIVRRKMALSSILSGAVTVPTFMVSAILVSSFLGTGGEVSLSPATELILGVSASLIGLSMFGFLRETHLHIRNSPDRRGILSTSPVSLPSMQGEDDWEESPKKGSE
jgi:hypothetical protein